MTGLMDKFLVFIGASVVLVPIFHRLGLGSVLGYLTAGILVGPDGFGFIKDTHSVFHFAELGVVLLLFVIGLEIQPKKLMSMRRRLMELGGGQIFATTAIFACIGLLLGLPTVTSWVLGFALSLSSTAFAVQTLNEKGQFNTEFGHASFSILLMQDLVAIPALAIIPLLSGKASDGPSPLTTGLSFLGIVIALVLVSRFLIRPLFRYIASTRSRDIFTAITLFIVIGVASLMIKIGLSAALGTFLAGVLLADSEYRHELEADLDPFKGLLMGLFFMAVGMEVSLKLIFSMPFTFLALALGYLVLKSLIIYCIGRIFRQGHENAKQIALTISQGGEFAFVIFGIVATSQLAEKSQLDFLTGVITLSMGLSPLLNFVSDKWTAYCQQKNKIEPKYDEMKDEAPQVIIAGYGRFGQTFARILRSQNIPFTAIEQDPEQIELVRKFGTKVYYGDASRLDLLTAAGAERAKYFILAIDEMEMSLATAKVVKENFPNLKIYARARNRGHVFELFDEGVTNVKREVMDSSANFVADLLVEMGYKPELAKMAVEKFLAHDEIMLMEQYKVRKDDKNFVSVTNQSNAQLEEVLRLDSLQSFIRPGP